ncbi:DUF4062 domain-containing protein [Longirhabdus pacifica]|uniref:DUF4062 domain-containing protein n=1 Tax=Longirhabdus pacifica TaxID=2305227 RepID=UPI0013E8D497|nr:DUF4062 domain-containing protein [Longirhabdus pacifica]
MLNLFISSTIKDLYFVRQTLGNQIENHLGHTVIMSESITFDWSHEDIVKSCLQAVSKADIVILIIGNRSGANISENGISITRAEYRQAKALRKPIITLIVQETWFLYQQSSDRLHGSIVDFIDEVSANFRRNICAFSSSEEAFYYIRAQLSNIFKSYLELNQTPHHMEQYIKKGEEHQAYYRFVTSLMTPELSFDRILSILIHQLKSGTVTTEDYVPQPIVLLSTAIGATLYRYDEEKQFMLLVGCAGDTPCESLQQMNQDSNYMMDALHRQQSILLENITAYDQVEKIVCLPIGNQYVMTIHFLVEAEYEPDYDPNIILEFVYMQNKVLLHTLHMFLNNMKK